MAVVRWQDGDAPRVVLGRTTEQASVASMPRATRQTPRHVNSSWIKPQSWCPGGPYPTGQRTRSLCVAHTRHAASSLVRRSLHPAPRHFDSPRTGRCLNSAVRFVDEFLDRFERNQHSPTEPDVAQPAGLDEPVGERPADSQRKRKSRDGSRDTSAANKRTGALAPALTCTFLWSVGLQIGDGNGAQAERTA
jgi:hypothetical protein